MHFPTFLTLATFLALASASLACNSSQGCCWGGNNGGPNGCENQHNTLVGAISLGPCGSASYVASYCKNNGVTTAECDADCCSISTQKGRGCP